jgi:NADH-quinone oxidoreductase subunit N
LTMTVANIVALRQSNVLRLLAYSSIAHMGYLLLGIVAGTPEGITGVYLYGFAYLFMNLGAFAVVIAVKNETGSADLSAFEGLSRRAPWPSALLVLFLISLAGIPPTAGFVAKFSVFAAAFQVGWVKLVLLGAINSVISVAYYFKVLHAVYLKPARMEAPIAVDPSSRLVLAITSFFTLLIGLAPQVLLAKTKEWMPHVVTAIHAEPPAVIASTSTVSGMPEQGRSAAAKADITSEELPK